MLSTDENLPLKQNTTDEVNLNITENKDSATKSIVQEISLDILNKIEEKVIIEPINPEMHAYLESVPNQKNLMYSSKNEVYSFKS